MSGPPGIAELGREWPSAHRVGRDMPETEPSETTQLYTLLRYGKRLLAISMAAAELVERSDKPIPGDLDFAEARERCRTLSRLCRNVSDRIGDLELDIKAHAPPHCDLRVREACDTYRCGMMKVEGDDWWLALARSGRTVLEIRVDVEEGEHSSDAAMRFEKACSMTPEQKLANMLAEQGV